MDGKQVVMLHEEDNVKPQWILRNPHGPAVRTERKIRGKNSQKKGIETMPREAKGDVQFTCELWPM